VKLNETYFDIVNYAMSVLSVCSDSRNWNYNRWKRS